MISELFTALSWGSVVLAAIPAFLLALNLFFYRRPKRTERAEPPIVTVMIPARDEEANIDDAVRAVLASEGVDLEVLVMDDHSTDRTPEIVGEIAREHPPGRLRLLEAPELPAGWNGKASACASMAAEARPDADLWVFLDADVRLENDGLRRLADTVARRRLALASGAPRYVMGTWAERAVVSLVHFTLLGYLPLPGSRWTKHPAFAAGCGQLLAATPAGYHRAGGHAAIRTTRADGLAMPRAFRRAGLATDLVDLTDVASCRLYTSAEEVWQGFAKNAHEGMATPTAIGPWTLLLGGGHVLPWFLLATGLVAGLFGSGVWTAPAALAVALGLVTRLVLALRFRQPIPAALLHPVGVVMVLAIQYSSLARRLSGRPAVAWKGRTGS